MSSDNKLNPEVKEKWLTALRSGDFEQGKDALKNKSYTGTPQHCCLGVLCEIAVQEGVIPPPTQTESDGWFYGVDGDESWSGLPHVVAQWAGLGDPASDMWVDSPREDDAERKERNSLSGLNDYGYTFEQIADLIEEQL